MLSPSLLRPSLLNIYLNDHLLGATAGVELARRVARASSGRPEAPVLNRLAKEIAEDREALLTIMRALEAPVNPAKVGAGRLAELLGRLKPNGHLLSRSPLSTVVELEGLRLGIEGKASMWRTLRARAAQDPRLDAAVLDDLLARAGRQVEEVERLRLAAAESAFAG